MFLDNLTQSSLLFLLVLCISILFAFFLICHFYAIVLTICHYYFNMKSSLLLIQQPTKTLFISLTNV